MRWWIGAFVLGVIGHFWLALHTGDAVWIERGGGFSAIVGALGAGAALFSARRFEAAAVELSELGDIIDAEQRQRLRQMMASASVRDQSLLILIAALGSAEQAYADGLYAFARTVLGFFSAG